MASTRNRGLGKGLEALFNDIEIDLSGDAGQRERGDRVILLNINDIKPNENQPRTSFDEEKLQELAQSIEANGVIQPILVRSAAYGYEIVAGERRWRAARKAGLREIPCIVREISEQQNMLIALIENIQREDLNPIEEAKGIRRMADAFGLTQEQIGKSLGKSRSYITNSLRLLKLPSQVIEMVTAGRLSGGHARSIAGIEGQKKQLEAAKRCLEAGWTVRDIEQYAREKSGTKNGTAKKVVRREKNHEIRTIEEDLKEIFGTRVSLRHGAKKGKIEIEYFSRDELERLLEMFNRLK